MKRNFPGARSLGSSEKESITMKKLFATVLLLAPTLLFGQSALEGTWRTNMDQSKLSPKPYTFSVVGGMYECSTCAPQIKVKADGTDQAVTGQSYDTLSVRVNDSKTIVLTAKKDGKTVFEQTRTVSAEGNTLALKSTSYAKDNDKSVETTVSFTRTEKGPAGANDTSGSWQIGKIIESDTGLTATYKWTGDELNMTQPTGENFTAKLDGQDYPYNGSYSVDSVSLKRIDNNTIEETNKRNGKVISVARISVSPDGNTMTEVSTNKMTNRTSTFISEKQSLEAEK
jgi:hypothetical protein